MTNPIDSIKSNSFLDFEYKLSYYENENENEYEEDDDSVRISDNNFRRLPLFLKAKSGDFEVSSLNSQISKNFIFQNINFINILQNQVISFEPHFLVSLVDNDIFSNENHYFEDDQEDPRFFEEYYNFLKRNKQNILKIKQKITKLDEFSLSNFNDEFNNVAIFIKFKLPLLKNKQISEIYQSDDLVNYFGLNKDVIDFFQKTNLQDISIDIFNKVKEHFLNIESIDLSKINLIDLVDKIHISKNLCEEYTQEFQKIKSFISSQDYLETKQFTKDLEKLFKTLFVLEIEHYNDIYNTKNNNEINNNDPSTLVKVAEYFEDYKNFILMNKIKNIEKDLQYIVNHSFDTEKKLFEKYILFNKKVDNVFVELKLDKVKTRINEKDFIIKEEHLENILPEINNLVNNFVDECAELLNYDKTSEDIQEHIEFSKKHFIVGIIQNRIEDDLYPTFHLDYSNYLHLFSLKNKFSEQNKDIIKISRNKI